MLGRAGKLKKKVCVGEGWQVEKRRSVLGRAGKLKNEVPDTIVTCSSPEGCQNVKSIVLPFLEVCLGEKNYLRFEVGLFLGHFQVSSGIRCTTFLRPLSHSLSLFFWIKKEG